MSTVDSSPVMKIARECPKNGKATVSVEFVATEKERREMIERIVADETELSDREQLLEQLGLLEEPRAE